MQKFLVQNLKRSHSERRVFIFFDLTMSIFEQINGYHLQIAAFINLTVSLLLCGCTSWILYDVNYEEKLLYLKAGYRYGQIIETKQWQSSGLERFVDLRPFRQQLFLLQICVSLTLVSATVQILSSFMVMYFKSWENCAKKIWFFTNGVCFLVIITSFSLVIYYSTENGWKEKTSMKLFYAVSGTHCFLTLHLLSVMGWDLFKPSENEKSDENDKNGSVRAPEDSISTRPSTTISIAQSEPEIKTVPIQTYQTQGGIIIPTPVSATAATTNTTTTATTTTGV